MKAPSPGINLAKLRTKVGQAPLPSTSTGPTAAELAAAISEANEWRRRYEELLSIRTEEQREAARTKTTDPATPAQTPGPQTSEAAFPIELAQHLTALTQQTVALIKDTKIKKGSLAEQSVREMITALKQIEGLQNK